MLSSICTYFGMAIKAKRYAIFKRIAASLHNVMRFDFTTAELMAQTTVAGTS
jgi:hypothetical protein